MRTRTSQSLALLIALMSLLPPAGAQEEYAGLRGIANVRLVVEDLDDDARACGISKDALDAAMRIPLSNTSLLKAPNSVNAYLDAIAPSLVPFLYSYVLVVRPAPGQCVGSVTVSLHRTLKFTVDGRDDYQSVTIWSKGSMLGGEPAGFGKRVADSVEGKTKQFIGAWLRSN